MLANIFTKNLRDQARPLLWWALALGGMALMIVLLFPFVRDNPGSSDYVKTLPKEYMTVVMGGMTSFDLVVPVSFLNAYLFAMFVPLCFLIYAILLGGNAIAGEEERKTLELLAANPVSRTRMVVEKFLAMCAGALALAFVLWLVLWGSVLGVQMAMPAGNLAAGTLQAVLLGLLFGALALALGAATGSRGLSIATATTVAIAAYFLQALAPLVDWLEPWQKLSPFYYYSVGNPLSTGLDVGAMLILLVPTLAFLILAVLGFRRRDLAV